MAEFQGNSDAVVSGEGVTVYQVFSEDEFAVPTVALKVVSERDGPVRVRLDQQVPAKLAAEEIGFHPDYGKDDWSVGDGQMSFETELPAEGETTTVYAIGDSGRQRVDELLDGLAVADVEALDDPETEATGSPAEAASDGHDDGTQEDAGSAGGDTTAGRDGGTDRADVLMDDEQLRSAGTTPEDAGETPADGERPGATPADEAAPDRTDGASAGAAAAGEDAGDPESRATRTPSPGAGDGEDAGAGDGEADRTVEPARADPDAGDGPLAVHDDAALLRELERRHDAGDLSEAARDRLRSLPDADGGSAVETRVEHLQQRVSDVEAFADSVQQLHEEYGRPTDAFEEMRAEIDAFADRLETLDGRVDALDDRMDDVGPQLDALGADVSGLEAEMEDVRQDVDAVGSEQEALAEDVATLEEWRDGVSRALKQFDQG
jgi:archaellum component FlaC